MRTENTNKNVWRTSKNELKRNLLLEIPDKGRPWRLPAVI
jgi:hypothetical protein